MKRRFLRWWLVALLLVPSVAHAELNPLRAEKDAQVATEKYGFCKNPPKQLSPRAMMLCPHAKETPGCSGFVAACDALEKKSTPPKSPKWLEDLLRALAPVAQVILWLVVIAVILALAVPLLVAWLRSRRDKAVADGEPGRPAQIEIAAADEALDVSDAEVLLARAGDHERRGDFARALSTYLAASLRALDMRGAIRLERHRTNGEYVRAVPEPPEKDSLRHIVREVDHVEYGGKPATAEVVSTASKRAIALVRKLPLLLLLLVSCSGDALSGGRDPAGDEVLTDLLRAQGLTVARAGPIASLPMPPDKEVVLLDASRTPLDEESEPHLIRWVKAGGTLILVGAPTEWPKALAAKYAPSTSRDITVTTWGDSEEDEAFPGHLARHGGIEWASGFPIARTTDEVTWAAMRELGGGRVLGMAEIDLITNAGLARPDNAAAMIAILSRLETLEGGKAKTIRIARPEDGTSPPSNPFSALVRAGLGLGLGHALVATLLLFLAAGTRRTRAAPREAPRRRAFVEHVEATGALWSRTMLAAHALRSYGRWVEERLRGTQHDGAEHLARAREARSDEPPRGDELKTMKALGELVRGAHGPRGDGSKKGKL